LNSFYLKINAAGDIALHDISTESPDAGDCAMHTASKVGQSARAVTAGQAGLSACRPAAFARTAWQESRTRSTQRFRFFQSKRLQRPFDRFDRPVTDWCGKGRQNPAKPASSLLKMLSTGTHIRGAE
jgi:hypothetical protein